jgi:hypothetical protein
VIAGCSFAALWPLWLNSFQEGTMGFWEQVKGKTPGSPDQAPHASPGKSAGSGFFALAAGPTT